MRTIRRTSAFKRDYCRERRGRFAGTIGGELASLVAELAADRALAPRHRDHALGGQWKDHRDCHVRPDLVRLGSHSQLGL